MRSLKDISNFSELLAAEAFVNLLASCCLDVRDSDSHAEQLHRQQFRTRGGVDIGMLDPYEQAVLAEAWCDRELDVILRRAGIRIREAFPETNRRTRRADLRTRESIRQTIDEALAYRPPVSLCSV